MFLLQGNDISDASGVSPAGLVLVSELGETVRSLALSSDDRAFSLLICRSPCSIAYCRTFAPIVGSQLSFCNSRRQGGSDAMKSYLLRQIEGSGSQEVDMAVTVKRGIRARTGSQHRDPALAGQIREPGSQPNPRTQ